MLQKQNVNIKHYFQEVIFPAIEQLNTATQNVHALYNSNHESIYFKYISNQTEQKFAFTNLQSVITSLELYSKLEAANIDTFYYQKQFIANHKNTISLVLHIRLQANAVVATDNQGNVLNLNYDGQQAVEQLQILVEQMAYRSIQQIQSL